MQQHPVAQADDLTGRADVDQHGARGEDPLDGDPVGRGAAGVEGQVGDVGGAAEARRAPVDVVHLGALGAQGVGEDVDARGDDDRRAGEQSTQSHEEAPSRSMA